MKYISREEIAKDSEHYIDKTEELKELRLLFATAKDLLRRLVIDKDNTAREEAKELLKK